MKTFTQYVPVLFVAGVLLSIFALPGVAQGGGEEAIESLPLSFWLLAIGAPIVGLGFAYNFYTTMISEDEGTDRMKEIAGYVKDGAETYLTTQYKVVAYVFVVIAVLLVIMSIGFELQTEWIALLFLTGGIASALAGWIGMITATEASARTTQAARSSLNEGLRISFRSGGVMGLSVVVFGLGTIALWFVFLTHASFGGFGESNLFALPVESAREVTVILLGYMMGASLAALFARVGGGIYTKAADVGADLVGKVEEEIPEDDPRNPGAIADNVGDNVGDVAGMGADLYESYTGAILATMVLAVPASLGLNGVIAPMLIAGIGILLSILGIYMVQTGEEAGHADLLDNLMFGINTSSFLIAVSALGVLSWLFLGEEVGGGLTGVFGEEFTFGNILRLWSPIAIGIGAGVLIGYVTGYYTSDEHAPTQGIAESAQTGTATVIIEGTAVGMASSGWTLALIVLAVLLAFSVPGGFDFIPVGLYGVGISAVGMLSTLGITLATDAYGPIADNAGGNAEMSDLDPKVRDRTDLLDALGNTTAATGKGFAIGSAALTALALLAAYMEEVRSAIHNIDPNMDVLAQIEGVPEFMSYFGATLINPRVLLGIMVGGLTVFLFSAMTLKAVGRAAGEMIDEIRRQFDNNPGIIKGETTPDYNKPIEISTRSALREMIAPTLLAIVVPIITSIVLGIGGVMGLLAGTISTGFLVAIMMANAGGAWDNAKKYIEADHFGGKGSEAHKASVVGDTVGDPFKDTTGPSLNILIKLMSIVSVIFAGAAFFWGEQWFIEVLNMTW